MATARLITLLRRLVPVLTIGTLACTIGSLTASPTATRSISVPSATYSASPAARQTSTPAPPPAPSPVPSAAVATQSLSTPPPAAVSSAGHITYSLTDGHLFRLAAVEGAQPEDLGPGLDTLGKGGANNWVNTSANGAWLLVGAERFDPDCLTWACIALVAGDLSKGDAVKAGGTLLHGGFGAVSSTGMRIVYPDGSGSHSQDLWVVNRSASGWSNPAAVTKDSSYAWNSQPAMSLDGLKVVFDCGDQPYGAAGTAICEVGVDGSGFRVVVKPEQGPGGSSQNALHHPGYAPDGSIVFEGDWKAEQIWRITPGSQPEVVNASFSDDNSPCVLPDGRIVSLWLERPGGAGLHEIKVMAPDGSSYFMALTGIDVADIGIGCGQ